MAIDIETEDLYGLRIAAGFCPKINGVPADENKLWRWHKRGARGADGKYHRLECTRVGTRICTSREALDRFFAALNREPAPAQS